MVLEVSLLLSTLLPRHPSRAWQHRQTRLPGPGTRSSRPARRGGSAGQSGGIGATGNSGNPGNSGNHGNTGNTGLRGPTGNTGPQGPAGDTGGRRPSDAYNAESGGGSPIFFPSDGSQVEVQQVSVPAGSYLLLANLQLLNDDTSSQHVFCLFPGEGDETTTVVPPADADGAGTTQVALQHAVTLASPATLTVRCDSIDGGSQVLTSYDNLTAVQVGTNH
jgi:hypothetical protein